MLDYGTQVVAGVTPGKGEQSVHGVPVYDTVRQALREHPADATVISVPPALVKGAVLEAIENGIKLAVVVFSEPGGVVEEKLSELVLAQKLSIPIIGFIAGRFVDSMPGVRFGHAATIVEGNRGSTKSKIEMFRKAGIHVAESFSDIAEIAKRYV